MEKKLQFCLDINCPIKCNNKLHAFSSIILVFIVPWAAALFIAAKYISIKEQAINVK